MLFDDVTILRGVGPSRKEAFARLGIVRVIDLVTHMPRRYEDRRIITPINRLRIETVALIRGKLRSIASRQVRPHLTHHKALLSDETGSIQVNFFNQDYILGRTKAGDEWVVFGKCDFFGKEKNFALREVDITGRGTALGLGTIMPYYPATAATPQRYLRRVIGDLVRTFARRDTAPPKSAIPGAGGRAGASVLGGDRMSQIAEGTAWPPAAATPDHPGHPSWSEALRMTHLPTTVEEHERGRRRLALDELVAIRICVERARRARPPVRRDPATHRIEVGLPFTLTAEQERIMAEIRTDMDGPQPMRRLVEGDVGSGKTVLAILAAAHTAGRGRQTAFVAPTEILAEQHCLAWRDRLEAAGLPVFHLTGATKKKERTRIYSALAEPAPAVVFGTHALFNEELRFGALGLVVIDEQQRFGVVQRDRLLRKGELLAVNPDMLTLTATPIPRTLAMTLYGDLEISTLKERLPGRAPVRTLHFGEKDRKGLMPWIKKTLAAGERIYIVYPRIEEDDELKLRDAKGQFARIKKGFPDVGVALLTGATKSREKEKTMRAFRDGAVSILVATSVVEVGIDVPEATLMIIEHAEHFGLAQLHQLRGRVGRGGRPGTCLLVTADDLGDYAVKRIETLIGCADGFKIAEEDLRLRGPGEILGERQHGDSDLRVARLADDRDLVAEAQAIARTLVADDPELEKNPFLKSYIARMNETGADAL
jgi:ATP-dependent DNA helicase RecG